MVMVTGVPVTVLAPYTYGRMLYTVRCSALGERECVCVYEGNVRWVIARQSVLGLCGSNSMVVSL